ncbi:MAG: hypothetical protein HRU75_07205 [Planctomycetia bacterium]|nr:MAG: hypothetical protein HRU75_07205 [Planctomycetia bacterium]
MNLPPCQFRSTRGSVSSAAFAAVVAACLAVSSSAQIAPDPGAKVLGVAGAVGHPTADMVGLLAGEIAQGSVAGGVAIPEPPLARGVFVNFESPPIRPLAYHAQSRLLAVANTPASSVAFWQEQAGGWVKLREAPVGLDPVTVAFEPGSGGQRLWVVNHVSDSLMVLDSRSGRPLKVRHVPDEPVTLAFNAAGTHAFLVCQSGVLVTLDVASLAILSTLPLPCNTPRALAYDAGHQMVYIAALHSGNNTTVVGKSMRFLLQDATTGQPASIFLPILFVPFFFAPTAPLFAAEPQLAPWPDVMTGISQVAPLVPRIISDDLATWAAIVDALADDNGDPDPAAMAAFNAQVLATFNLISLNTPALFREVIHEARQTVDHDVIAVSVANPVAPSISHIFGNVGDTLTGAALNPVSGALWLTNMQARNTVRLEQNLRGHNVDHELVVIANPANATSAVTRVNLHAHIPGFDDASVPNAAAKAGSIANPIDVAFRPDGSAAFVLSLGADRVGVRDAAGAAIGVLDVGRGPRGIVVDSVAGRLFVLNRTDHSLSILDLPEAPDDIPTGATEADRIALFNPEPVPVKAGRDFLYSTRRSNNFSSSCAVCHVDGTLDHRAWDLGDSAGQMQHGPHLGVGAGACNNDPGNINHPLKGPMVTLSLRGLDRHDPFHWRGDRPGFVDFNGAFDGLLGGSTIPTEDMQAFDRFIRTLVYPPNPNRNRDNTFADPAAENGAQIFMANCNVCHMISHDGAATQSCPTDVGDLAIDLSGLALQTQLVPQLRELTKKFESDLYNGFGLLHHGTEEREQNNHPIETFVIEFFPGLIPVAGDLIAFLDAWPSNVMPVVGMQVLVQSGGVPGGPVPLPLDVMLMINQHEHLPSRCDVIAKRTENGVQRGYFYSGGVFQTDLGEFVTLADLVASASAATPVVFMAVPPGSGMRLGIDQDWDGFLDGLDTCPQGRNDGDMNGDGLVNNFDIDPFVLALIAPAEYAMQYPGLDPNCAGDVDNSGALNNFDIDPFVAKVIGP